MILKKNKQPKYLFTIISLILKKSFSYLYYTLDTRDFPCHQYSDLGTPGTHPEHKEHVHVPLCSGHKTAERTQ